MFTVSPDPGSTLNISNRKDKNCKVCTGSGSSRQCSTSLVLQHNTPVSVEFGCSRPQDVFTVETVRNIGEAHTGSLHLDLLLLCFSKCNRVISPLRLQHKLVQQPHQPG